MITAWKPNAEDLGAEGVMKLLLFSGKQLPDSRLVVSSRIWGMAMFTLKKE